MGPSPQSRPSREREQGPKRLLADGQEQAVRAPGAVVDAPAEVTLSVETVHEERSTRAGDECHDRVLAPPEPLVPRHGEQRLGGVRLAPVARLAELLEVRAVAVAVVPLEQLAGDELEADLDRALPLDRVVLVVDLLVAVAPGATGVPELDDDAVHVRELQLDLDDAVLAGPALRVAQEGLKQLPRDAAALVLLEQLAHLVGGDPRHFPHSLHLLTHSFTSDPMPNMSLLISDRHRAGPKGCLRSSFYVLPHREIHQKKTKATLPKDIFL